MFSQVTSREIFGLPMRQAIDDGGFRWTTWVVDSRRRKQCKLHAEYVLPLLSADRLTHAHIAGGKLQIFHALTVNSFVTADCTSPVHIPPMVMAAVALRLVDNQQI